MSISVCSPLGFYWSGNLLAIICSSYGDIDSFLVHTVGIEVVFGDNNSCYTVSFVVVAVLNFIVVVGYFDNRLSHVKSERILCTCGSTFCKVLFSALVACKVSVFDFKLVVAILIISVFHGVDIVFATISAFAIEHINLRSVAVFLYGEVRSYCGLGFFAIIIGMGYSDNNIFILKVAFTNLDGCFSDGIKIGCTIYFVIIVCNVNNRCGNVNLNGMFLSLGIAGIIGCNNFDNNVVRIVLSAVYGNASCLIVGIYKSVTGSLVEGEECTFLSFGFNTCNIHIVNVVGNALQTGISTLFSRINNLYININISVIDVVDRLLVCFGFNNDFGSNLFYCRKCLIQDNTVRRYIVFVTCHIYDINVNYELLIGFYIVREGVLVLGNVNPFSACLNLIKSQYLIASEMLNNINTAKCIGCVDCNGYLLVSGERTKSTRVFVCCGECSPLCSVN